ncbi:MULTISPECIES: carbonate dehydratase [unclassified Bacillus (in: firmicutes)]|uniref:carbonate dehydratase n=1 Tax=unclassified Bacillus (in: firmicutes) TaxID=185979 RepID=UPI000BEF5055|nr:MULTISPECIES: carbonate dehydratase [unclassified Bacillus (in: firmicutes)]PEJ49366.1 carbonate dehydratase [Bacillus sp. AFS002410]PEL13443.1 carbonate dehydratase [Bacillus sp. AFS017336]
MGNKKETNSSVDNDSCCFEPFISPNPITSFNPVQHFPTIDQTAFISQFSSVIGDVTIKNNVYVAPNVSIRADEGTPFYIGSKTNIQDGVVLHGLLNKRITVDKKKYSIFIGDEVSVAHGALIHGPCYIADKVFVGFNSIIYTAIVGKGAFISYNAVVTNGVRIAPNKFVPPGANIDTQEKADSLSNVPKDSKEFAAEVQRVNQEFPASYHLLFGKNRCSCGLACEH